MMRVKASQGTKERGPSGRRARLKTRVAQATWSVVFGVALAAVGAKGALWVYNDTELILRSRVWVPVDAEIERRWVEPSWGVRASVMFSPRVQYRFQVNGVTYRGNRFEIPTRRSSSEAREQDRIASYVPGSVVQVLFDPEDPSLNVLTPPEMNYWFTLGMGSFSVLVFVTGLVVCLTITRSWRRLQK